MTTPITHGIHHVGLTVSKLDESVEFFVSVLGWKEVRRDNDYPVVFVSDGSILLTLWAAQQEPPVPFNRKSGIGLHHLAFQVETAAALNDIHERLKQNGTPIEFPPQLVGPGPAQHTICYEPSGIRVEFFWPGN
ncbi:MAG: VOC family protein [Alcaligenaceae bacterium]|nr:VOC family protein [Alcaligenaceae bacterium]